MSAAPVYENPKATVGFNRKVSVRQYESAEASIYIQVDIDPENTEATMAAIKHAMFQAKSLVFEELGLSFSVEEGGVIRELIGNHFGNVTEVTGTPAAIAPAPAAPQQAAAPTGGDNPPFSADTQDKGEKAANKQWAVARIASNPDDFYDNRLTRKNPKAPDFKHKTTGLAVWL
jgi:hypothetical protein